MSIIEFFLPRLGWQVVKAGYNYRKKFILRLIYQIFKRNATLRLSISCLLKIQKGDKYLLIRNVQRSEQFGPIGGVSKYYLSAQSFLTEIDFEVDSSSSYEKSLKLERDLRGYTKAKNLFKFINWFEKKTDRELNCLDRELKEEFEEILEKGILDNLKSFEFSHIKQIFENPHKVSGKQYLQFRIFDIEQFSQDYIITTNILDRLSVASITNKNLIWVTADEIRLGIDNKGNIIGSHSIYLIDNKRTIKEDRPWAKKK